MTPASPAALVADAVGNPDAKRKRTSNSPEREVEDASARADK